MGAAAAGRSYIPNTGVLCVSSGLTGGCCIEGRDLISDLRASMASGWVSRKPRSQKAAGPLLHWGENKIRVNASNKTDASRTKICWHALHIFTHGYAEKPVNHFVGAAVSLLGGGGGSHLSLSRCKCYELRELLFLPLHISGQLSVDSRGTSTRWCVKLKAHHNVFFFALLDIWCNTCFFVETVPEFVEISLIKKVDEKTHFCVWLLKGWFPELPESWYLFKSSDKTFLWINAKMNGMKNWDLVGTGWDL